MSDCCSNKSPKPVPVPESCCHERPPASVAEPPESPAASAGSDCCGPVEEQGKPGVDWLLWGSFSVVLPGYLLHLAGVGDSLPDWAMVMSHGIFELINTMWWGVVLAALFVGVLTQIPQNLITAVLGKGGTFRGIWRATLAGTAMDLCSHGILMVGMQLYKRGASLGQVMAFLIASPWNSFSLTIILIALIGWVWTLTFIVLSLVIALISGVIFDRLVERRILPPNPTRSDLPADYHFWRELRALLRRADYSPGKVAEIFKEGISGSQMVLRWLLFGVVLASAIRGFVSLEDFQAWFGPTALGLVVTLIAATIIEVCSEGSSPIAADLVNRGGAPGNGFAFMMTGVSTDYTEVMVIRDTMASWKIALFLPLVTVPQVIVVAAILNHSLFAL